ncbi:MAG: DUF4867 family protein [Atopobiaceae bacterium]|jgi:ureidoglycolate hydrolase|nr:DUF4867 family protein [Atopobiaceae bacterium]MCI2172931.1 DUF4867 family protein [Atopobiaceae bacterium]MCI2208336.1 DUF4867 family protein [Atopobiaceae bacterium]
MQIKPIADPEFAAYGRVIDCPQDTLDALTSAVAATPLPEGTSYVPEEPSIQDLPEARHLAPALYGGLPAQFGCCNGHNTKLNCLEYHRCSEFNLGSEDFILLLAKESQIEAGTLDTSLVRAFRVPAGTLIEVYADTLHYTPCHADPAKGFRVLVVLMSGTNCGSRITDAPAVGDSAFLWKANKWVLAHPESPKAAEGAACALVGDNIDVASLL